MATPGSVRTWEQALEYIFSHVEEMTAEQERGRTVGSSGAARHGDERS